MTGDPSAPTLARMYALGVRNFDSRAAFRSLYRQATVPHPDGLSTYGCPGQCAGIRPDLAQYMKLGYVPQDGGHSWGGASESLEDAVADYSLADCARASTPRGCTTRSGSRGRRRRPCARASTRCAASPGGCGPTRSRTW